MHTREVDEEKYNRTNKGKALDVLANALPIIVIGYLATKGSFLVSLVCSAALATIVARKVIIPVYNDFMNQEKKQEVKEPTKDPEELAVEMTSEPLSPQKEESKKAEVVPSKKEKPRDKKKKKKEVEASAKDQEVEFVAKGSVVLDVVKGSISKKKKTKKKGVAEVDEEGSIILPQTITLEDLETSVDSVQMCDISGISSIRSRSVSADLSKVDGLVSEQDTSLESIVIELSAVSIGGGASYVHDEAIGEGRGSSSHGAALSEPIVTAVQEKSSKVDILATGQDTSGESIVSELSAVSIGGGSSYVHDEANSSSVFSGGHTVSDTQEIITVIESYQGDKGGGDKAEKGDATVVAAVTEDIIHNKKKERHGRHKKKDRSMETSVAGGYTGSEMSAAEAGTNGGFYGGQALDYSGSQEMTHPSVRSYRDAYGITHYYHPGTIPVGVPTFPQPYPYGGGMGGGYQAPMPHPYVGNIGGYQVPMSPYPYVGNMGGYQVPMSPYPYAGSMVGYQAPPAPVVCGAGMVANQYYIDENGQCWVAVTNQSQMYQGQQRQFPW